ncbi:hypothetical protein JTB14_001441 [Gonioctena quinquepunctata]|nr:hypothetical protein JTB14_001441 [Gonioctena quinquepunctata]
MMSDVRGSKNAKLYFLVRCAVVAASNHFNEYISFAQERLCARMKPVMMLLTIQIIAWICIQKTTPTSPRPIAEDGFRYYNVGVLMASHVNYPFDLERCGPAIDMALEEINEKFLYQHKIRLKKVQKR